MNVWVALGAIAGLAAGANAECTPLQEAVASAGLTSLAGAIASVTELDGAAPILEALSLATENDDKLTIFAPSEEAFRALDGDVVPEEVLDVLLGHIVAGELKSDDIIQAIEDADPEPAEVETLLGTSLEATLDGDDLIVSPDGTEIEAKVVTADVETCAGVVHIVDQVLVPAEDDADEDDAEAVAEDDAEAEAEDDAEAEAEDDAEAEAEDDAVEKTDCVSITDAATEAGLTSLAQVVAAVASLEGASALVAAVGSSDAAEGKLTVFAPNNEAFEAIEDKLDELTPDEILTVLLNHVVADELFAANITAAIEESSPATLESLLGADLEATVDDGTVIVTPAGSEIMAKVVTADVVTCSAIIHVIDAVLVPEEGAMADPEAVQAAIVDAAAPMGACTPLGIAAEEANLTALVDAIEAVAELEGAAAILAAVGATEELEEPLTLIAPNNEAFDAISDVVGSLGGEDVLNVLLNHIIAGDLPSTAILEAINAAAPEAAVLETLLGASLEGTLEDETIIITPAGTETKAKVVVADVDTCAGTVHVVDMVLVPSPDFEPTEETSRSVDGVAPAAGDSETGGADGTVSGDEDSSAGFSNLVLSSAFAAVACAVALI